MKPEIIRTRSFAEEAASFIVHTAEEAIEEHGFFQLALSGGNTPRAVYQALALRECRWPKWIVTFGDERCVPPDDPQSNYRMASEAFLMLVGPGEVFRIQGEIDPEEAAAHYNSTLKGLADRFGEERYTHDLILLGLGTMGIPPLCFRVPLLWTKRRRMLSAISCRNSTRIESHSPIRRSTWRAV